MPLAGDDSPLEPRANGAGRYLSEAPVLLGHSMGGRAAMGYALRHPLRVRALAPLLPDPRARQFFQTAIEKGRRGSAGP